MVTVSVLNIENAIAEGSWRDVLPLLPEERRERALRMRDERDGARAAMAGWLLQYALAERGIPREEQAFTYDEYGKPALLGRSAPQFSLSHSGHMVVCAVGEEPLGVDVESERVRMTVARRYFSPAENDYLAALPEKERPAALARIWTGKEAYAKALGLGLALELRSFSEIPAPYRVTEYVFGEYHVAVCVREAPVIMEELSR